MSVKFSYADAPLKLAGKTRIKRFIKDLVFREGKQLHSLTYVFCSDDYLLQINKQFLQHDYYTDIITFDLSEPDAEAITGEVYVSVERVMDNARQLSQPFGEEMRRVLFHGALHLCGYGDKKKSEIVVMRNKENEYLRLYDEWH